MTRCPYQHETITACKDPHTHSWAVSWHNTLCDTRIDASNVTLLLLLPVNDIRKINICSLPLPQQNPHLISKHFISLNDFYSEQSFLQVVFIWTDFSLNSVYSERSFLQHEVNGSFKKKKNLSEKWHSDQRTDLRTSIEWVGEMKLGNRRLEKFLFGINLLHRN